jgi:two-component system response regulator FixJ
MATTGSVHVIDDDEAVRDSLAFLLRASGYHVEAHSSPQSFLARFVAGQGTCVITDVRMPEMNGIDLLERLKKGAPDLPVIVMTGHGDIPLAVEAMRKGAIDFIEKPFDDEKLLATVELALKSAADTASRDGERTAILDRLAHISGREQQVLVGLVAGKPNKVIAHELDISPRTVEVYRANLMTKMQAGSLSDLVRMALLAGLDIDR